MKAMLLAAGLGTRLKPFTDHHPKALAMVDGVTLLEHNLRYLQKAGIRDVVVNVHHFADQIEAVVTGNNGFGSNVTISDERNEVLETGGGIKKAGSFFRDEAAFIVMNVDIITNLDLSGIIDAHVRGANLATLAVMKRESSRHLLFDKDLQLTGWQNNKTGEVRTARQESNPMPYAFSGIQVLSGAFPAMMRQDGKFSVIDAYLDLAAAGQRITGYDHTGDSLLDVGKPESLEQAAALLKTF